MTDGLRTGWTTRKRTRLAHTAHSPDGDGVALLSIVKVQVKQLKRFYRQGWASGSGSVDRQTTPRVGPFSRIKWDRFRLSNLRPKGAGGSVFGDQNAAGHMQVGPFSTIKWARLELTKAKRAICGAIEAGINFFDTADVYSSGESERILGRALHDCRVSREGVVVATKCSIVFPRMAPQYTYKAYDASENYIRASCEQSLKRLNTDHIDLFQVHRIDYLTHPEETAQALEQLQREGKIRHAGVSNYSLPEIRALATYIRLESLQTPFSLLDLEPLEVGYQAICLEKSMTLLAYRPLARAALTGTKESPHSDWQGQRDAGVVVQLRRFADEYNLTVGQLSLAWLLQMPGSIIPLVGTANVAHIREAAVAAEVTLARDDWYEMLVIARGRPMPWRQKPYFYLKDK